MKKELELPYIVPHPAQQNTALRRVSRYKMTRVLLRTERLRQPHNANVRDRDDGGESQRGSAGERSDRACCHGLAFERLSFEN